MYRVYFNRELEWPQCWSVDQGDQRTEINVCGFEILGALAKSKNLPPGEKGISRFDHPFAWLEVDGVLQVDMGIAKFYPPKK